VQSNFDGGFCVRFEFLRFEKPSRSIITSLRENQEYNLDGVLVRVSSLDKQHIDPIVEDHPFPSQTQVSGSLSINRNRNTSESQYEIDFIIRTGSRIWLIGTDDNPLLLQWCLDFFKDVAGLEPDYQPFDRTRINTFLQQIDSFKIRVDTPRGPRNIESMTSFSGNPLLSYDLASADLLFRYEGEFEIELSLQFLLIDSSASKNQREFALQSIEKYLF
jgi:hypothetical protein